MTLKAKVNRWVENLTYEQLLKIGNNEKETKKKIAKRFGVPYSKVKKAVCGLYN